MDINKQRKIIAILKVIRNAHRPLGSTNISEEIQALGINLSHRTVRYYLSLTDEMGLTRKISGRRGREITPKGEEELQDALVFDKVGLIASKIDDLSYKMTFSLKKKKVVLLGAGGASRAIIYALCREKAEQIIIVNRTFQKAKQLTKHFQKYFPKTKIIPLPFQMPKLKPFLKEADLLINTTSVGLKNDRFKTSPLRFLPKKAIVSDLIHNLKTPFLKEAKKRGHRTLDGLGMFVEQAALSFQTWTRSTPP